MKEQKQVKMLQETSSEHTNKKKTYISANL